MLLRDRREAVARYGRKLETSGLTAGTGGNVSCIARDRGMVAITPSGVPYEEVGPADVVVVDLEGRVVEGGLPPSSELAFHRAVYAARPDVEAVVHTHSLYATAMACLRREIPPVHYLLGFAGTRVPVAPYATYGTEALADRLVETLGADRNAALLANHGVVAVGRDLAAAFAVAEAVEFVARICLVAGSAGEPVALDEQEMGRVIEKFKTYGRQPAGQGAEGRSGR